MRAALLLERMQRDSSVRNGFGTVTGIEADFTKIDGRCNGLS
jgi:hypothetical protein